MGGWAGSIFASPLPGRTRTRQQRSRGDVARRLSKYFFLSSRVNDLLVVTRASEMVDLLVHGCTAER